MHATATTPEKENKLTFSAVTKILPKTVTYKKLLTIIAASKIVEL